MTAADATSASDDALISVWHQALVEQKKIIAVGAATFSVRRTSKHRLTQIDFQVDGIDFCALEQNPQTKSRWAKRGEGAKVMQFLRAGRYIGVVADGVLKHYSSAEKA
jgi:hypothetical protein